MIHNYMSALQIKYLMKFSLENLIKTLKISLFFILIFATQHSAFAHNIGGIVYAYENSKATPLPGATVRWIDTDIGTSTDVNGKFELDPHAVEDQRIIVSYIGFTSDTILIETDFTEIILLPSNLELSTVEIKKIKQASYISSLEPRKTEVISQLELTKAACCDLAGCFETQSTVQAQTTNVLTNARELRILGLSGVYNQLLINGLPMTQGLTYTYGISGYPGTLVENIFITKGATSVLQGFDGWSGQINMVPKSPDSKEKLLLNMYINSFDEKHVNFNYSFSLGKQNRWKSILSLHQVLPSRKIDNDDDNFMDLPQLTRSMLYNNYQFNDENSAWDVQLGYRILYENRIGGQMDFDPEIHKGSNQVYGQSVRIAQPELFSKIKYNLSNLSNVSLQTFAQFHNQQSYFGTTSYDAEQFRFYLNLQHEIIWNERHLLKYGVGLRIQNMQENIQFPGGDLGRSYAGIYNTDQRIPGAFLENAFHWNDDQWVWIVGARVDHHQQFGSFFTPRSLLKYAPSPNHVFRFSAGSGWRQLHLFTEHLNLLASSRDVIIDPNLEAERGWNYGVNYTFSYEIGKLEGNITTDYYQTLFTNQIFPDYETDPGLALIQNYFGKSVSNAFQIETNLSTTFGLDFKFAYNHLDVFRIVEESKQELPFNPKHRFMSALSYRPNSGLWYFDVNAHLYGSQKLPSTSSNPVQYQRPERSKSYYTLNIQATRIFSNFELYAGVENLFDFRQNQPILAWQEPFSQYFDTSFVWGPTRGRELYLGFRWTIDK